MSSMQWFAVRKELRPRPRLVIGIMSFVLPLLVWSLVSYVPWIWHPMMEVTEPGGVSYFKEGTLIEREVFDQTLEMCLTNTWLCMKHEIGCTGHSLRGKSLLALQSSRRIPEKPADMTLGTFPRGAGRDIFRCDGYATSCDMQ